MELETVCSTGALETDSVKKYAHLLNSHQKHSQQNDWMSRHKAMKDELKSLKEECRYVRMLGS